MLRPIVVGVRDHTAPNAVVAATAEAAVYLYTGRHTVPMYGFTVDELFHGPDLAAQQAAVAQIMRSYRPDAIVGSTDLQRTVLRRVGPTMPASIVAVDSFPGSVIYRCTGC
jgi:hypothetical protein